MKLKEYKLCKTCTNKCKMKGVGELVWCPKRAVKSKGGQYEKDNKEVSG